MRLTDGSQLGRHSSSWTARPRARLRAAIAAAALLPAALLATVAAAGEGGDAQLASLSAPQGLSGSEEIGEARFGTSAAISADGSTAIVGGPEDNELIGAAWVFERVRDKWKQQGPKLTAEPEGATHPCEEVEGEPPCGFGTSVALSSNGNVALIGSPQNEGLQGVAWVYTRSGATWTRSEKLTAGEEPVGPARFGHSVSLSADGSIAIVGGATDASGRGAAWVFVHTSSGWVRATKLTARKEEKAGKTFFGASVALSRDGARILVGAPGTPSEGHPNVGAAWLFTRSGEKWTRDESPLRGQPEEEVGAGRFGFSVALSAEGTTALVGARTDNADAGAAWAFADEGGKWVQVGPKLQGGAQEVGPAAFGWSVALSASGEEAAVGAPADAKGLGATWLFKRSGAAYALFGKKISGETGAAERVGAAVALSQAGTEALLGAPRSGKRLGAALAVFGIPVPAPTVESITPASGPTTGATAVTIEGSGFLPGANVTIGREASAVEFISGSKLTARTGANAPGSEEVVVSDEYGTSSGGPNFTYEAPTASPNAIVPKPEQQVLATTTNVVAPPVLAVSGNIAPVSGRVYVRLPGTRKFVVLTGLESIPFGTIIDAREGTARITTRGKRGLQSIDFYEGEFQITQRSNGVATAALYGGNFGVCPTKRERAHIARASARRVPRNHIVRKLWGSGHGTYTTKGNYATGAVLGTVWETIDRCDGTGIHVITDSVLVTNLVTHKRVRVTAGHTYVAKAP